MDKITVGRVVYYTLTPSDVERITKRRANNSCAEGNPVAAGQQVAMEVTAVNAADETVNGQCTLDGNDAHWVGNVKQRFVGDHPWGRWFWPRLDRPEPAPDSQRPDKARDQARPSTTAAPQPVTTSAVLKTEPAPKSENITQPASDKVVIPRTAEEDLADQGGGFTFPAGEGPQPGDTVAAGAAVPQTMPAEPPAPTPVAERPLTRAQKKAAKSADKAAKKAKK